jgi:hypothetical protein
VARLDPCGLTGDRRCQFILVRILLKQSIAWKGRVCRRKGKGMKAGPILMKLRAEPIRGTPEETGRQQHIPWQLAVHGPMRVRDSVSRTVPGSPNGAKTRKCTARRVGCENQAKGCIAMTLGNSSVTRNSDNCRERHRNSRRNEGGDTTRSRRRQRDHATSLQLWLAHRSRQQLERLHCHDPR